MDADVGLHWAITESDFPIKAKNIKAIITAFLVPFMTLKIFLASLLEDKEVLGTFSWNEKRSIERSSNFDGILPIESFVHFYEEREPNSLAL
jgi:hypothetical protein